MNVTAFKAAVDAAITNKAAPLTISPSDVGTQIKALADLMSSTVDLLATKDDLSGVSSGIGNAVIDVAPSAKISTYNVSVAGTYPLYGGLIVTTDDLAANFVQFRYTGGVWVKFLTAKPTAGSPVFSNDLIFTI